jgi:HEAT repeat protein
MFRAQGPSLRLLSPLLDALDLEDGDLRWSATHMLATLARQKTEAVEVLLHEARQARTPLRRRMALYAVREVAPERRETREALLAALDADDPELRRAALTSLAKLSEPDEDCLDRTLEILERDPDLRMRRIAAVLVPELARPHPGCRTRTTAGLEAARGGDDPVLSRAAEAALSRLA